MMVHEARKVLLIGYGNPGRLDDGLGPALAAAVEEWNLPRVTVDSDYQLHVEDAAAAAQNDVVIFADADVGCCEPFCFNRIEPEHEMSFSSHSCRPEGVLGLAHKLFNAKTEGYVLGIRGYEFNEFEERLSDRARSNLAEAVDFMKATLRSGDFTETNTRSACEPTGGTSSSNRDQR